MRTPPPALADHHLHHHHQRLLAAGEKARSTHGLPAPHSAFRCPPLDLASSPPGSESEWFRQHGLAAAASSSSSWWAAAAGTAPLSPSSSSSRSSAGPHLAGKTTPQQAAGSGGSGGDVAAPAAPLPAAAAGSSSSGADSTAAAPGRMSANGEDQHRGSHRAMTVSSSAPSTDPVPWLTSSSSSSSSSRGPGGAGAADTSPHPPPARPIPSVATRPGADERFMLPAPPIFRPPPPSISEPATVTLPVVGPGRPYTSLHSYPHPYSPQLTGSSPAAASQHHLSSMFPYGFPGGSAASIASLISSGAGGLAEQPYSQMLERMRNQADMSHFALQQHLRFTGRTSPPSGPLHPSVYPLAPPPSGTQSSPSPKDKDPRGQLPSPLSVSRRHSPYPFRPPPHGSSGVHKQSSSQYVDFRTDRRSPRDSARQFGNVEHSSSEHYSPPHPAGGGGGHSIKQEQQHHVHTTVLPQPPAAEASAPLSVQSSAARHHRRVSSSQQQDEAAHTAPPPPPPQGPHYPPHFMKGSIIQLASGDLKQVEDLRTDDFIHSADISPDLKIDSSTVVRIDVQDERGTAILGFSVGEQHIQVTVEATLEHPFFVFGQGWSSCSPERTSERYRLTCHRLKVGDVCISLTHKETLAASLPSSTQPLNGRERPHSSEQAPGGATSSSRGNNVGGRQRRWSAPDLSSSEAGGASGDGGGSGNSGEARVAGVRTPSPGSSRQGAVGGVGGGGETSQLLIVDVKKEESDSDCSDVEVDDDEPSGTGVPQPHS